MSAARIITTTEKFDEMGKLVERITTEEFPKEKTCECTKRKQAQSDKAKEKSAEIFGKVFYTENPTMTDVYGHTMIFY